MSKNEARDFYNEILNEPSTSQPCVVKPKTHMSAQITRQPIQNQTLITLRELFYACEVNQSGKVELALKQGLDPDARDPYQWTPLMVATSANSAECVKILKAYGANIHLSDRGGNSAMSIAKSKGFFQILSILKSENPVSSQESRTNPESTESKDQKEAFCEECQMTFVDFPGRLHKATVTHMLKAEQSSIRTIYGISEANKGFRMMIKGGWDKDKGLGPEGSGKKFPVKTMLKRDRKGVGAEDSARLRVTHFKPNDPAAVSNWFRDRRERETTLNKRARESKLKRDQRREKRFRQEFQGM